jgi:hypothetical protein
VFVPFFLQTESQFFYRNAVTGENEPTHLPFHDLFGLKTPELGYFDVFKMVIATINVVLHTYVWAGLE